MTRLSGKLAGVATVALLPGLVACGKTEAALAGAGAAAAAAIGYTERGATTTIDHPVTHVADATELAFRDLGIVLTEREPESDGIELKGSEDDWKIVVDVERDPEDALTDVEVTVSKDQVNYSQDRAERVLRRILQRV